MAVGKRCAPPRGGGSARSAIKYVLAEELTAKVGHQQVNDPIHPEQREGLSLLMAEACARPDRGADVIWSPTTSDGLRPSSIYARGVTSLYTADIEIQAVAGTQTRCKSPVAHFIISVNEQESKSVSNEQMIRFSEAVLDGAGWKGHAGVFAVHRDTENLHCHVVLSSVHSETLRAYNRQHDNLRLHTSLRHRELEFGMATDWGLAVIRDRGLATERVERVSVEDWSARKRKRTEDRVEQMARHFISDESLESVRDRQDRIVHALREYLDRCTDRGEKPLASDIHIIAARLTARVEGVVDGKLTVRLMERAEKGTVRSSSTDDFRDTRERTAHWAPTDTLIVLDERRIAHSPLDDYTAKTQPNEWLVKAHAKAIERRAFLLGIGSLDEAEAEYRHVIAEDPGRVTRDIVFGQGQANFTADDVDALLATHITDGWEDETDRVLREDTTLRILSADTASPLYTIEQQKDLTEKFDGLLRRLLTEKDPFFDRAALDEAISRVESRLKEKNPDFHGFTNQQHKAFDSFERRLAVWNGDAGVGKSVLNDVHREMAEIVGREIVGFATAQKAADVLADSSGIRSVNQARALFEESRDGTVVMPKDARFTFDEFSMASIESGVAILERAVAANASGVLQGDLAQLPNIAAGNTFGVAARAAADEKTLVRLNDVFRQRSGSDVEWLRYQVPKGGRAIRTANAVLFGEYLEQFMDRGHVTFHKTREEEISAIATDIVEAMRAGERVIAPGRSFQDCLYVNRAVRAGLGFEGTGREFEFDRGVIELAVGERVLFRQNNRRLDVRNGDTGTVNGIAQVQQGRWRVAVTLDNGKVATFDPARYQKIEYGYASTIHANQGTGAPNVIGSITKSDDARSAHVTFTRTESVLHVHTHLQRDEILERLTSDRALSSKDDALLFQSIVNKTGGAETPWAKAVQRAQQFDSDPLRRRHEAVMAQRQAGLRKAIISIMSEHRDVTPRDRDRQLRATAERFALDTFVAWAAKERAALEAEWEAKERVARPPNTVGLELLKVIDKISTHTPAHAAALGEAWRTIYRDTLGSEPPRGRELAQLLAQSKTTQTLLDRAMKVAGIKPSNGAEPPKRSPKR
jgi:AAA domain/Relaxase/Mobilisation nuclease domain